MKAVETAAATATRRARNIETTLMDKYWQGLANLSGTQRRRVLDFLNSMHAEACMVKEGSDEQFPG